MAKINKGYIDEEARKELNKQVLKGTETAKEMNRTELNFLCEIFSMLKKLNEEGIQKIIDLVDGDLNGIVARLKATIDVSKNYRNFAGISDDMDGQVKFIYRTDEIQSK